MKVVAAGTGPASGFPVARCGCAACRASGSDGLVRAPGRCQVRTPDGSRHVLEQECIYLADGPGVPGLLWAPNCTELPAGLIEGLAPASVGLALLGPGSGGDLRTCARAAAALRTSGALAPDAEVVLIGATHDSARSARRALLLRAWGMTEAAEGQEWTLPPGPGQNAPGMTAAGLGRVLVIGGSASGKSQLAEDLLASAGAVSYLATGQPARPQQDAAWAARVRRHQLRRPGSWDTLETQDPATALRELEHPLLLDSLGSWLTGVLDRAGAWDEAPGWRAQVELETQALAAAYTGRAGSVVVVTDEVGWGVVPATPAGRLFRDLLGQLNQLVADASDEVLVVVAGQVMSRAQ